MDALETLNKWYDEGHYITFFTSRLEEHRAITELWLKENGFFFKNTPLRKTPHSFYLNSPSPIRPRAERAAYSPEMGIFL